MAEEVIANIGEVKIIKATVTGPASYTSGGFSVRIGSATKIKQVLVATNDGGYKVDIGKVGVSDNSLTVPVEYYNYPATAAGTATEVPAGTNLSGVNFEFVVIAV